MGSILTPSSVLKFIFRRQGRLSFPITTSHVVTNVRGSSDYKKPNGCSCIEYWEQQSGFAIDGRKSYICPSCGRMRRGHLYEGGHVTAAGRPQDEWYFVPLCPDCNHPTNTKSMSVDTVLVPVPPECYEKISE